MTIPFTWRGALLNAEVNALHAEAFDRPVFVNVAWDGLVHAFVLDTMVASRVRRRGVGKGLVAAAVTEARAAGCGWLHVDFEDHLRSFYFEGCGFVPTNAGLIAL